MDLNLIRWKASSEPCFMDLKGNIRLSSKIRLHLDEKLTGYYNNITMEMDSILLVSTGKCIFLAMFSYK